LEVAVAVGFVAGEGDLRNLAAKEITDLPVCDIAHLVVLLDNVPFLVADAALITFHEGVAGRILGTDIAIKTGPAIIAVASLARAHRSVFSAGKGTAHCKKEESARAAFMHVESEAEAASGGGVPGLKQSSPPKPSGQSHFPLYSLQPAY
jgi:hypothetical protein